MNKPSTSFRLSPTARMLLREAAQTEQMTTTAYLEHLIRQDVGVRRRTQQIEAIASIIANWLDEDPAATAERVNSGEGWTVDLPSSAPNSWSRFEGVVLTPGELDRALGLAATWNATH